MTENSVTKPDQPTVEVTQWVLLLCTVHLFDQNLVLVRIAFMDPFFFKGSQVNFSFHSSSVADSALSLGY